MAEKADPIGVMTKIVDETYSPTPFFIQQWNSQLEVNTYVFNPIVAGEGLAGGGVLVDGGVTLSLPDVGTAGTYGSATEIPVVTTDPKGRVIEVVLEPISTTGAITVEDDGTSLGSFTTFNFVGDNWTLTDAGDNVLSLQVDQGTQGVVVQDDGVGVVAEATTLNFVGAGVQVADAGSGGATVTVVGGISGVGVEDDGSLVTTSPTINFTGAGVVVTDTGTGIANVAIAGGTSGVDVEDDGVAVASGVATLNFAGGGVAVTDVGSGRVVVSIAGGGGGGGGSYKLYTVTNKSFEDGNLTGWTESTTGQWTVRSGSYRGVTGADTGTHYLTTTEPTGTAAPLYQDITLDAASSGGEVVELSYSAAWPADRDTHTVSLVFLDGSGTELGRKDHRPWGDAGAGTPWYKYVMSAILPASVATVRISIISTSFGGSLAVTALDSFSDLSVSGGGGSDTSGLESGFAVLESGVSDIEARTQGLITLTRREDLSTLSLTTPPTALVLSHTSPGDGGGATYIYGGGVLPVNGWGIDPSTVSGRAAYGYFTNDGLIENEADLSASLRPLPAYTVGFEDRAPVNFSVTASNTTQLIHIDQDWLGRTAHFQVGSGVVVEIDIANAPLGREFSINVRDWGDTGRCYLNPGIGRQFRDYSPRDYLELAPGDEVKIERLSNSVYIVSVISGQPVGRSATGSGRYIPIRRDRTYIVGGQSLGKEGYEDEGFAYMAFQKEIKNLTGINGANIIVAAAGGSGVSERDVSSGSTNYWANQTAFPTNADGPLLNSFKDEYDAFKVFVDAGEQPAPSAMIWKHGQQSSAYVSLGDDGSGEENPNFTREMFISATNYIFSRVRAHTGVTDMDMFVEELARRSAVLSSNRGRMKVIRSAQEEIVANGNDVYFGAEVLGKPLRDTVHPSGWSYYQAGRDDAARIARETEGVTTVSDHPTCTSAVWNPSRKSIEVRITGSRTGDRFYIPEHPTLLKVFAANGTELPIGDVVFDRISGNTLDYEILLEAVNGAWPDATGGELVYLDDYGEGFQPSRDLVRIIRTRERDGAKELRSFVRTITAA